MKKGWIWFGLGFSILAFAVLFELIGNQSLPIIITMALALIYWFWL
jgi:hypothetical protein